MLTQPSLTLARRLKAPASKVFEAWTDPTKIVQWFGPGHTIGDSVKADMDVGSKYLEVTPYQRLVFSWAWHSTPERVSQVTVVLREEGDVTLLTLTHDKFFDEAARDGHKRGWTGTLDKLEKFFA